jgi:hypothetical protein
MSKLHQLKDEFIDALLKDLNDPEKDPRVYETIRAFLKDWKSEIDSTLDVPTVDENAMPPAPFKIREA